MSFLLIAPAWWPWRRDWVWSTLLRARAIENGVWVVGCCIAGSVFEAEDFAGAGNHVFDPLAAESLGQVAGIAVLPERPHLDIDLIAGRRPGLACAGRSGNRGRCAAVRHP